MELAAELGERAVEASRVISRHSRVGSKVAASPPRKTSSKPLLGQPQIRREYVPAIGREEVILPYNSHYILTPGVVPEVEDDEVGTEQ